MAGVAANFVSVVSIEGEDVPVNVFYIITDGEMDIDVDTVSGRVNLMARLSDVQIAKLRQDAWSDNTKEFGDRFHPRG